MTIPTRPAPPPPGTQIRLANRSNRASLQQSQIVTTVKAPPPRPPPPKVQEPLSKKSSGQSVLSNIFGAKKASKKGYEKTQQDVIKVPPKIPAPPSSLNLHHHHQQQQQQQPRQMTDTQLISFDDDFFSSTSASPTLTQKSSSDCVSVDSFSSESYSPHNGGASGESGFEDDFSVTDFKVSSNQRSNKMQINDPFDSLDHFALTQTTPHVPSNIRNVRVVNVMQPQNAISLGSTSFYASTNTINCGPAITKFDDSLCNGKSLIQPQAILSMPTIIKPTITKGKVSPTHLQHHVPLTTIQSNQKSSQQVKLTRTVESFDEVEEDFSSLPSLPMPKCPPPPPPTNALLDQDDEDLDQEKLSHGFTLYDYESDLTEDLNFKVINLIN